MPAAIEADLDELYGADLDEFVQKRNELAKRVRETGNRDAAEEIGGLQKPSVVAWAANQVARQATADLERLLDAGDRLRAAQQEMLKGRSPAELEQARRDQEDAVGRLVAEAAHLLEERRGSATGATLERLAATLRAAAVQDDARELLRRGRLEEEVAPLGFESVAAMSGLVPRSAGTRKAREAPDRREQASGLREAVKKARQAERNLQAEARKVEREAQQARREAEKLERKAAAAAQEAEAASAARAEAEQQLKDARRS